MQNREYGRDVSYAQGAIDWTQYDGKFAIIKVGGGDDGIYTDDQFGPNRQGARDKGTKIGFYWFGGSNDPIAEADYFINQIGELRPGETIALDSESGSALDPEWCGVFLSHCFGLTGIHGYIYMSASKTFAHDWSGMANSGYPLWVAHYGVSPNDTVSVGYWLEYKIHQFTDQATIPGHVGAVDGDVFLCNNINDWDNQGYTSPVSAPSPTPEPPPESALAPATPMEPPQSSPSKITPVAVPTPSAGVTGNWLKRFINRLRSFFV